MDFRKKDDVQETASRLVKLLQHAELQSDGADWCDAAAALVAYVHLQVDGCLSRNWQLAAEAALVIPALVTIFSRPAAAPTLKLQAVEALRLSVCTNDANQKIASSAAAVQALVDVITIPPPPPPSSQGPKAAVLARDVAEQLRDTALEALSDLLFLQKTCQDTALAADVMKHLILFVNCAAPRSLNPAPTQAGALRVLANLTRGNVI
jgi:hypothetical protein